MKYKPSTKMALGFAKCVKDCVTSASKVSKARDGLGVTFSGELSTQQLK